MAPDERFDDLMGRLRCGDDEAARAVFQRFSHRLIALARVRLGAELRGKLDPEDVLQSVFRSFFVRQMNGALDVVSWDSLWGLLSLMTIRKCANRVAYFHAACRDAGREWSAPANPSWGEWEVPGAEPTPAEAAALTDLVEALMRPLSERDRTILSLHLQGYTIPEVSAQAGRSERTVSRVIDRVRMRLHQLREDGDPLPAEPAPAG